MNGVIYARYSSDNQREESIEGQLRECKAFAEKNDILIVDSYIDRAFSAKTDNRPAFQKMIKDSAKNMFDVIIVWKLDRFARNRYDSAHYKAQLRKNGVRVISANENISEGSEGIILESVLEGMAEYYSADLSEKVIRGQTENAMKCKFNGGPVTFGYYIDGERHFQIDEESAPYVRMVFKDYDSGMTMKDIAEELNNKGATNTRGGKFTINIISKILSNRRYVGDYIFRDIVIPNGIPAIVDKKLFDRVQQKLEQNKHASAKYKADDEYILTTKILFLVSEETRQKRYRTQVNTPFVSKESRNKLIDRLSEKLSKNESVQIQCEIPFYNTSGIKVFDAIGIADVLKDDIVYELKFVSELKHTHFLQCACYMLALNLNKGILWNTRNNKAYQIMIPNKDEFLNLVTNTITKGYIKEYNKPKFALVDTETNFNDQVMSIGIVIADTENYHPIEMKYYILEPEYKLGGMFSNVLQIKDKQPDMVNTRENIILDIENLLRTHGIQSIFAYNVSFDYRHLPELSCYNWYDIMKLAAYKQYNSKITDDMKCYATGRLKCNSDVEDMVRLLVNDQSYCETHNALHDAIDELSIMRHLGRKFEDYNIAIYKPKSISKEKSTDISFNSYKENTVFVRNEIENTVEVEEISKCIYNVGDKVEHTAFGIGIILSIQPIGNDNVLEVVFERVGKKRLMANFAKLTTFEELGNKIELKNENNIYDDVGSQEEKRKSKNINNKKDLFKKIFKRMKK